MVLLTSQIGGLVNERGYNQQGSVQFSQFSGPLWGNQLEFRLLLLDAQSPGGDLFLHLSPAFLFVLLTWKVQNAMATQYLKKPSPLPAARVWCYFTSVLLDPVSRLEQVQVRRRISQRRRWTF